MTIDHDAVLSARVLLLGSGRPSRAELAGAYRVLAEVSPRVYVPKLVDAVLGLHHEGRDPKADLALAEAAAWAARNMESGARKRAGRLCRALNAYQTVLFALARRAEGRVVCEELAEGSDRDRLASGLAEERRFREAAEQFWMTPFAGLSARTP
ncbi:hypothetical protein [Streptomyces sp. R08]|uniref:Uncharacterized protein n=1 Tax=Streptomyces sp. R08 TaxID=3238624 RepID=A0AB39MMI5_9ACTN